MLLGRLASPSQGPTFFTNGEALGINYEVALESSLAESCWVVEDVQALLYLLSFPTATAVSCAAMAWCELSGPRPRIIRPLLVARRLGGIACTAGSQGRRQSLI